MGVCRMFIKDDTKIADPINMLTRKEVPFEWGEKQEKAQKELVEVLKASPADVLVL